MADLKSLEVCAGAGGQALGLEEAGFSHESLVEIEPQACQTLRANRPHWSVIEADLAAFDARAYRGIDLLAGGVPCPPFTVAGKQLGRADERDLFPVVLRLVDETRPRAVLIENVRGLLAPMFREYRDHIVATLKGLGYQAGWQLLNASDFGVPQLRPRAVLVGIKENLADDFKWPGLSFQLPPTVGDVLFDLMASRGWRGAKSWRERAKGIAPTIVGGSKKHGGPDLGPTRAKQAWAVLGVDGLGIADEPPARNFVGMPKLTVRMVARLQGFPDVWRIEGRKTSAYRQIGNAFPPPVSKAVGEQIFRCLTSRRRFVQVPRVS
jgi:DNA (cytosine-5)-methyltransferase 1